MSLKKLQALLLCSALILNMSGCSTSRTVTVDRPILIAPPSELFQRCEPKRVEQDTVESLAQAYVHNTYEVWKCNSRLELIEEWTNKQKVIYGKQ